jgi:plasmid maintenance system antidote protein VapI
VVHISDRRILSRVDPDWFWSQVQHAGLDECWPWLGSVNDQGYGRVTIGDHQRARAHRVAYLLGTGKLLGPLNALHTCDNPPCCNYACHLFPGTQHENIIDMVSKGRASRGPEKLTPAEVAIIKSKYGNGESAHTLAVYYGVQARHIRRIANGTRRATDTTPLVIPLWKAKGLYGPHTKITPTQVTEIRTHYQSGGMTQRALATKYGLSQGYVSRIITNRTRG